MGQVLSRPTPPAVAIELEHVPPGALPADPDGEAPAPAADASAPGRSRAALVLWALPVLVLGGFGVWWVLANDWWPVSDDAIIASETFDVGSHTPLLGSFSRYGWRHPGPALFYVMAPFAHLLDGPRGLLLGALTINVAAIGGILWIVHRYRSRVLLGLTAIALFAMVRSVGLPTFADPWNPWVPLFPFLFLLFACWDVAAGHTRTLPWAVLAGSFAVQCHVGYALPVTVVLLWTTGVVLASWRRGRGAPSAITLVATAGVALAVWWPALVEQRTNQPGNLELLVRFFTGSTDPVTGQTLPANGPAAGAGLLAREVVGAPWLGFPEPPAFFSVATLPPALLVVPVALLACTIVASRRRSRAMFHANLLAAVALGATFVALGRVAGGAVDWIIRFSWATALFVTVVVAWTLVEVALDRLGRPARGSRRAVLAAGAAYLVTGALLTALVVGSAGARPPLAAYDPAGARLGAAAVADLQRAAPGGDGSVAISSAGAGYGFLEAGLVLELQRAGFDVSVAPLYASAWPEHRRRTRPAAADLLLATTDEAIAGARADPSWRELSTYHPTPAEAAAGVLPVGLFRAVPTP